MNARAWVWLGLSIAVLGCEATVGASGGGGGATGGGSAGGGASGGGSAVELDSGAPDAGAPDAGAPDSGTPDAGAIDAGAIVSRTFTPLAATVDVPNPERGFYKWFTSDVLSAFDAAQLATLRGQGFRLVHFPVNLSGFRTQNLSTAVLSTLGLRFGELRAQRLKAVVLFSYNFDASGVDATSSQIAAHLAQLKPVLEANADVIAFTRAGFIGAWGEWHSSTNQNSCGYMAGGTPCSVADANRLVVRDALLSGYAPSTSVGFRYPGDVIKWFPTVLDGGTSQQARVAFHNDCFLAGPTDTGTYASATSADRAYVASATEFVPFGGETCDAEQPLRTACADILAEGARYHLAWLNFDYHPSFVTAWTNGGCFDRVKASIGYRVQLDGVRHVDGVRRGEPLEVSISLRNVGWSRVHSARALEVVLSGPATVVAAASPLLRTLPSQATQSSTLNATLTVPTSAPAGRYQVWLRAPDAFASVREVPEYALRFANADGSGQTWSQADFRLSTGTFVDVQ